MKLVSIALVAGVAVVIFITCKTSKVPKTNPVSTTISTDTAPTSGPNFSVHIRTTEFQTPEQEKASFHLPPGFEITLFASEPDITKPINMEFDAAGRLWVTQSSEYPMAAPPANGHDRITILEDTNNDGKADKFLPFAENLDIPIGITPVYKGAIAYSIPNIYRFTDNDGDGKSDSRKILFGPFGYRDTHGMVSNLMRGYDGWIHACHGFTNTSTVAGTDGDSITMVSGNTFRFREDGSRVEQTTYGRVNPFGFTFDDWGYLYSVDCHSKPIYQLVKGAEYPHFGKKAPAIGFAPEMMSYELGSTALSGLVYYIGNGFPEEYQNCFYNGDVVTCRINRNTISWEGSSPVAKRQQDFLSSSDPWFRPVNIKMGPDGALYVADFYNKIIGHYEVPLNHPGRDRHSGRIWKITYTGNKKSQPIKDWSKEDLSHLIAALNHPQLNIRMNIANEIVDRFGASASAPVLKAMQSSRQDSKATIQCLWILYRLNALPDAMLDKELANNNPMIKTHALRVLGEKKNITDQQRDYSLKSLDNENPHVRRMATEVLAAFPKTENVARLISMYKSIDEKDNHLRYETLVSLRQNLKNKNVMNDVASMKWSEDQLTILIKVIPDVPTEGAASFALDYLQNHRLPAEQLTQALEYIGRYAPSNRLDQAIAMIRNQFADDIGRQYQMYETVRKGINQKGDPVSDAMRNWGLTLAQSFLSGARGKDGGWVHVNIEKNFVGDNPWNRVNRSVVRDAPPVDIIWSAYDWSPTGKLISPVFNCPEKLSMDVFDDDLRYQEPFAGASRNVLRVRLEKSQKIIAEYRRTAEKTLDEKDVMHPVNFDLSAYKDQPAFIEVIDSSRSPGGIGIGNINPAVVKLPEAGPATISVAQTRAAGIIGDFNISRLEPELLDILRNSRGDINARTAAANALLKLDPKKNAAVVAEVFNRLGEATEMRQSLTQAMSQSQDPVILNALRKGLVGANHTLQLAIAGVLAQSSSGVAKLLEAAKASDVEADLLEDVSIKERIYTNSNASQRNELDAFVKSQSGREDRKQIIADRLKSFDSSSVTVMQGKQIFTQNCSMCHSIKGNGGMIGPQLDGIGNWGQKALTEKILNPNGNISEAFRVYNLTLNNGKAVSGLYRREEGAVLIFANPGGQEFSVAKADIKEKVPSKYTLMPDVFRNTIPKKDFDALLKFLLNTKE